MTDEHELNSEEDLAEEPRPSGKRQVLAGFEIISRVGRGGMGTVYKARQISMDRVIALKILAPHLTKSKTFIKRFFKEARAAAKLNHPNIVQGIDAGEADGYYYFAMEFVDGETVHRIITRETVMEEKRALRIALDVARGLDHAFSFGLVHRDVKPGNIMVAKDRTTKLCDLGLAIEVDDEVATKKRRFAVGTPYYLAPEVAQGLSSGGSASDIYSLGATLFRMLCGRPPFDGATPAEILHKHVHDPPPWPKDYNSALSQPACYVLLKMLAKTPEERYKTPSELMSDLRLALAGREPAGFSMTMPVARRAETERAEEEDAAARAELKRRGLEAFVEIRKAIDEVAKEQNVPRREVLALLRGNLDESRPETFLKYGLIGLADRNFRQARADFRTAGRMGAKVEAYIGKLDELGAPPGMVLVDGGKFLCGPPENQREEELPGFYVDIYPVTNSDYRKFVQETGAKPPPHWPKGQMPEEIADHPVVEVTYEEAAAYAAWQKKRLPTELEWEKAARGIDGNVFPWGNTFDAEKCNVKETGLGALVSVKAMPRGASPYGCVHMAGNARHWTSTVAPATKEAQGECRIVRGGSFADPADSARTFVREAMLSASRSRRCGFRCVKDL